MQVTYFLTTLVNIIIDKYLTEGSRCLFLFKDNYCEVFEYHGNVSLVVVDVTGNTLDSNLVFQEYGCQGFIIQSKDPVKIFNQLEYDMKFQKDRFNMRKYLILITDRSYNYTPVFDSVYLQYVSDFLLIYPQQNKKLCKSSLGVNCENQDYALLTHKYVGKEQNESPVLLDLWFSTNQSFLYNTLLYPNKITNQEGRILRTAFFTYEPYSITDDDGVAAGTEHNAIILYVKKHNMTLAKILEQDEKWGIVFENFTGMGIMGRVVEDEADIAFTALYTWEHEYGFMDFTKPLVRTGITCLVPAPILASGWLTPLFPFSLELWIATTTSFIVCFIFIFSVTTYLEMRIEAKVKRKKSKWNQIRNFGGSIWSVYSMFMLQGVEFSSRGVGKALKYAGFAFILSLLITSAYSGGLASVMTVPRFVDAIETVDDLINSGMRWGAPDEAWTYSMLNDETPAYKVIVSNFVAKSAEEILEISKSHTRMGFSLERLPSGHYAIGEYITEDVVQGLRLMREDLYWEHCIFMVRKNSVLLESINDIILRISASGLHIYWESMAAQTHMDLEVQNIVQYYSGNPSEQIIQKLKWMHVQGAFAILGIGHALGLICFILEVIVWKIS